MNGVQSNLRLFIVIATWNQTAARDSPRSSAKSGDDDLTLQIPLVYVCIYCCDVSRQLRRPILTSLSCSQTATSTALALLLATRSLHAMESNAEILDNGFSVNLGIPSSSTPVGNDLDTMWVKINYISVATVFVWCSGHWTTQNACSLTDMVQFTHFNGALLFLAGFSAVLKVRRVLKLRDWKPW